MLKWFVEQNELLYLMNKSLIISFFLGVLMILSATLAVALTPTKRLADQKEKITLDAMIPKQFGDWRIDESILPVQVDAETQAKLDKIYNQTLARTYVNSRNERIMLSIAYGGDQSDNLAVHKPEVCYYVQGFEITKSFSDELNTQYGKFPIKRLLAIKGNRTEPITYWITVGDKIVSPGMEQKLQQIRYGLTGSVPDGMLVRISNIDNDYVKSYNLQQLFIENLLIAISSKSRISLTGIAS